MRKAAFFLTGLTVIALSFPFLPVEFSSAAAVDAIYLGGPVERGGAGGAVVQPAEAVLRGDSPVRYGMETSGGEKHNFLRLANFDGIKGSGQTSVSFLTSPLSCTNAEVHISYRLFEGSTAYREDAPVFCFSYRGAEKRFRYGELDPSTEADMQMHELTFPLQSLSGTSDRFTVTFYYADATPYAQSGLFADVTSLSVTGGGSELVLDGAISSAGVTEADEKVYVAPTRGDSSLLLFGENAVRYAENTVYDGKVAVDFNDGLRSVPLARQGSSGTYRGTASVSAQESDIYAVYDRYEQNTFLRLSNSNGAAGVTQTRFYTYFYDNTTGAIGNIPLCDEIFFSFRYRLFMDDYVRAGLTGKEPILHFSTRSSAANHAGEISLDELIVNEAGDDSWHTYSSVLDVRRSSTANLIVTYYAHAEKEFAATTFLDFDALTLATSKGGRNYAHLNGEFEGLADGDAEGGALFFREELGSPAQKMANSSLDYAMSAEPGQTFSVHASFPRSTNVFDISFDVTGTQGAAFDLLLNGRSGDTLSLTVGKNSDTAPLSVYWTQAEGKWRCHLGYARAAYAPLTSIDFVNSGNETLLFDNLEAGQVRSVCAEAGDFAAYSSELNALKERIAADETLCTEPRLALDRLLVLADRITQNSSEARMQSCLSDIKAQLQSARHKADTRLLDEAISAADRLLTEHNIEEYTNPTRLSFLDALAKARQVTAEDGQTAVDAAANALTKATAALLPQAQEEEGGARAAVVASVAGGTLGTGALLCGAILFKRRHSV